MEQKKRFIIQAAYYAVAAAAMYLLLRYALPWLLPFLLALRPTVLETQKS